MTVTMLIADPFPLYRRGVRACVEDAEMEVLGEASDAGETVQLVRRNQPNVLVIDAHLAALRGQDVLAMVSRVSAKTRILVVSGVAREDFLLLALRRGALGYVLKGSPGSVLLEAVRAVREGRHYIDPAFAEVPLETYLARAQALPADPLEELTTREKEVLQLVAEGKSSADIAQSLHLSSRTIEQHRASLRQKLRLRTHTELVCFALRRGLISLEGEAGAVSD